MRSRTGLRWTGRIQPVINPRGAGCRQGEADGTRERVPGSRGVGVLSRQREGRLPAQQDQHIPPGHTRHAGRDLAGLDIRVSGTAGSEGVHESVKKDGNQMSNKQRKLSGFNQEVRQRLTCLGFEVTAPFSSGRTVMGGVGFFPHPNFGGRADLRWAETSSVDSFHFRPCPSLNISVIWDKAGLAGTKLSRHLYSRKNISIGGKKDNFIYSFFLRACSLRPSDITYSRDRLERLQPGVARGAVSFGGSEVLEAICMALSIAALSGQTALPTSLGIRKERASEDQHTGETDSDKRGLEALGRASPAQKSLAQSSDFPAAAAPMPWHCLPTSSPCHISCSFPPLGIPPG